MKKMLFVLVALLIASPAMADVDISASAVVDGNTAEITISYEATAGEAIRAVAIDVQLDGELAVVTDVNCVSGDFTIYPGSISIAGDGSVSDYGSCECDDSYAGTLGGTDTNGVTLEMGSLYVGAGNAPGPSGDLAIVTIFGCNAAEISLALNAIRGGVVLEDPDEAVTVNLTGTTAGLDDSGCPVPDKCMMDSHPDYADWVALGEPNCWCYERQCEGDADGGIQFGLFWVYTNDLDVLKAAFAQSTLPPDGECADFAHDIQFGLFRVYTNDLDILKVNFAQSSVPVCDATDINFWIVP